MNVQKVLRMVCLQSGNALCIAAHATQVTRCPHGMNTTSARASIQILHCGSVAVGSSGSAGGIDGVGTALGVELAALVGDGGALIAGCRVESVV